MSVGNVSVPFLNFQSFVAEESEVPVREAPPLRAAVSPFVSVYELENGQSEYDNPMREAYSSIVNELYDEEFDEALFELSTHARGLHRAQLAAGRSAGDAERIVTQHFSQLVNESESAVERAGREFGTRDEAGIVESEIESFVEGYAPSGAVEPAFENFLGKLVKKVGRAVKSAAGKAVQGLKKVGLGFVLGKIRALVRPLLNRVLQKAIGRLPEVVRPAAQQLAIKLGLASPPPTEKTATATAPESVAAVDGGSPAPEGAGEPVQAAAGADADALQAEFDAGIAEALLAEDEAELELETARAGMAVGHAPPVFAELDDARETFIQELEDLKAGESAEPYIQNFLPAVLPALRIGVRLIGRPRVVNFLAQLLAKLVAKLIGPASAPALSRAIVDSGLKLLNLELSETEKAGLGASAVAAAVEETVYRVASLPEHVLDDQELLEGFALEAFEQAAAANLPSVLPESVYKQRPELLEGGVNAGWVLFPLRGRKRYKRCSKTFNVRITPHAAEAIESFEGAPLSDYLQDQLGLPEGSEVDATVHLYEVLPGSTVEDIAASESETVGLGGSDEATLAQLHPLTEEAASVLLGRPGLGRKLAVPSDRRDVAVGQRLYHLAIAGKRPLAGSGRLGRRAVRRLAHLNVVLDAAKDQIQVSLFLSEVKAQKLAVRLRQQSHPGSLAAGFHKFLARRLPGIVRGRHRRRLRVVAAGAPGVAALQNLSEAAAQLVSAKLQQWLTQGFVEFAKNQAPQFLAAAENPADGVTLAFTIEHPPGLKELCAALLEKGAGGGKLAEALAAGAQPAVRVDASPGHRCG